MKGPTPRDAFWTNCSHLQRRRSEIIKVPNVTKIKMASQDGAAEAPRPHVFASIFCQATTAALRWIMVHNLERHGTTMHITYISSSYRETCTSTIHVVATRSSLTRTNILYTNKRYQYYATPHRIFTHPPTFLTYFWCSVSLEIQSYGCHESCWVSVPNIIFNFATVSFQFIRVESFFHRCQ